MANARRARDGDDDDDESVAPHDGDMEDSRMPFLAHLGEPHLAFGSLTEPFWVDMSVALWAGIFVASPAIFYQLWKFIAPGLYKRERKLGLSFGVLSGTFFIAGALFCYYFA